MLENTKQSQKLIFAPLVFVFVLAMAWFLSAPSALAITISPPTMEIALTAGQSTKTVVKLYNETSNTVQLYTEARDFTAKGETGQPAFDFDTVSSGLSTWLQIETGPIVIESGQRAEVPVTINAPADASPGGHYASLFFSSSPPQEGQVRISSKVGTLILAEVAGDISEKGSIVEFGTGGNKSSFTRLPITFFTRFQNSGNIHERPTGTIVITNMFGREVAKVDVNARKAATLPDSIRKYEAVWEKDEVVGGGSNFFRNFWNEYTNERKNFGLGRYRASLSMTNETGTIKVSGQISFWIFPWHVLLVWSIVVIVVIILLIILIRKYNHWILKRAQK